MASLTDEQKNVIMESAAPLKPEVATLEVPDFWTKHKNKAWVAILLAVGALGGNVDEVYKAIPDVHDVAGLRKEVATLKTDVEELKKVFIPAPTFRPVPVAPAPEPPVDDGFRVERPTKQNAVLQNNVTVA